MDEPIKCPKCGSTQITANKKGFSGTKAATGIIIAGGIGLAAGDIGSNKIIITCLKCGHQFKPGSQISKKQGPMTISGFTFLVSIAIGIFIPICGGSWWFLLILPILGLILAMYVDTKKSNTNNTNIKPVEKAPNYEQPINNRALNKQKIICNNCNGRNEIHFKYCRICGKRINIDKVEFTKDHNSFEYEKCPHCNQLSPKKSNKCRFCVNCGKTL